MVEFSGTYPTTSRIVPVQFISVTGHLSFLINILEHPRGAFGA
jgi:hypothetical protein